jgi:hypothetical protein
MNQRPEPRRALLRGGLLAVAATPLTGGIWALLLPRAFYDGFPLPGAGWVSNLGPYNEHLIRDYGALNLGLSVMLVAAALVLERRLLWVALTSWLVFEVPHFVFHLGQTHHFSAGSNLAQLGGLAFLIVLPLVLLFVTFLPPRRNWRGARGSGSARPRERSAS